ncbi:MAG TPA: urate hydroxylase PuuD [Methylomirabilota bacterium]|jgi:uncharacterized membrane protein|nr:urate hydroxylase PuuD [Methylomirabilota bacterium]
MGDWVLFLLRWLHFLAGITWIGMLYYFNFVQTPFFGSKFVADNAAVRSGIVRGGLLDTALWWFRWGAMITFLTGWLYVLHRIFAGYGGLQPFFAVPYGWSIFIGGTLGTVMWANVWFVIWPAQQIVMASAAQVAGGGQAIPEAAARGTKAGVTSRTNTMLSVPMLFFMGAASHFAFFMPTARPAKIAMLVALAIIVVLVEWNALSTTQWAGKKMLTTVKGTLWVGFVLTAVFFVLLKLIFA